MLNAALGTYLIITKSIFDFEIKEQIFFEKFGDFIFIVKDPDPHLPNLEDPDPHTINADPQH